MSTNQNQINAMDRYQDAAARTANHDHAKIIARFQEKPELIELVNYAMGAAGEAGEICDLVKKIAFHGHEYNQDAIDELIKECGDELWYISNMGRILKTKLSSIAAKNIDKLKKRYPEGFKEADSINREE